MTDWRTAPPAPWRPRGMDWLRIVWRALAIGGVTYGGLILLLLMRIPESLIHGQNRPWTPHITRTVCRTALRLFGLRLDVQGRPMQGEGAIVANHGSWLDIFVLNACDLVYFVAKAEVHGWAGIGWLARATGTMFIARKGTEAKAQEAMFRERLHAGHRLLFFPEGTSTDAIRILPFKSTLFAAFLADGLRDRLHVQPVTVLYHPPKGEEARFYGWWGDMDFAGHLLRMLAAPRHGCVTVTFHPPLRVSDFPDRKVLAAEAEAAVRSSFLISA